MLRGFYTAASGMITMQRQQEALSNNLANVNTVGYKADQAIQKSFPELLLSQVHSKKLPVRGNFKLPLNRPIGSLHTGVYVQEMIPDFSQGDLKATGLSTDLSLLSGDLPDERGGIFFAVQNEAGELRFTRNGHFTVDGNGFLTTSQGYYVLDESGSPINTASADFTVTLDGDILTDNGRTPLGLTYVNNVSDLEKEGNDLYRGDGVALPEGVTYEVHQGYLERSNVDPLRTMTAMMEAYRSFELNQRVLRTIDQNMEKAVNDVGRIG